MFAGNTKIVAGRIATPTNTSLLGRAGGQVSYVTQVGPTQFLVPFANASYWHNFMNETHVDFVTATGTINATNFGPKDFMQYEVGVSATDTALGVVGFVKGTFRDGDAITGSAISAGGRINF